MAPQGKRDAPAATDISGHCVELVSDEVVFKRYGVVFDRTVRYPNGQNVSFDVWSKY